MSAPAKANPVPRAGQTVAVPTRARGPAKRAPGGVELTLLDQAPVAAAVVDRRGRIVFWNRGAEELYGVPRDEALGTSLLELATAAGHRLPNAVADGTAGTQWSGRGSVRRADGTIDPVLVRASRLVDAGGGRIGTIVLVLDAEAEVGGEARAAFGRRIAQARREAGLTQRELAEQLGVTRRSLQGYEAGVVAPYRHLPRLAEVLQRPGSWFLQGGAEPEDRRDADPEREGLRDLIYEGLDAYFAESPVARARSAGPTR